jgi:hypothetical protein
MRRFRKQRSGRRVRPAVSFVALVSVLLALAPPSLADPGRPGVTKATRAVYPSAGEGGGVLGGGGGGAAGQSVAGGEGLPFTGFAAPLVLLIGLIVLGLGLTLRITSSRIKAVR